MQSEVIPDQPLELKTCAKAPDPLTAADLSPTGPNWEAIAIYIRSLYAAYENCAYVVERSSRWFEEAKTATNTKSEKK